jgi:hypothetical protein
MHCRARGSQIHSAEKGPVVVIFGIPDHLFERLNRLPNDKGSRPALTTRILAWGTRGVLTGAMLLAPASVVSSVASCSTCSEKCEQASVVGVVCYEIPAEECAADQHCAVRTGCHCAALSSTGVDPAGCKLGSCPYVAKETECLKTTGCEWGDACQEKVICNSLGDENSCNNTANSRCSWMKDGCGGG